MTRKELQEVMTARPFVPFTLHVPDGDSIVVHHPEFVSMSPDSRAAWIWAPDGGGRIVDLLLVSHIELGRRRRRRSA